MLSDFHLHTLVSDGTLDPAALVQRAAAGGVTHLAITDHDALGAYTWEGGRVFSEASRLGLELSVGIEMDADLDGLEVHLLGFGLRLDDGALTAHLERVREARWQRARRELEILGALLGPDAIREEEIFAPGRQTLMKPHFIHPLLERGRFATYEEANRWFKQNVQAGVAVPKPPLADAIALIQGAGGWTSLAHPGYYQRDGYPVAERLAVLRGLGLDGVELDYPYHACSPHQWSLEEERAFIAEVRASAEPLGLRLTRGSDSHTPEDFDRVYGARRAGG
jgi:predicted metal-dependent phosphoesterase TrpH